jgi:HK97 family phage portal protein
VGAEGAGVVCGDDPVVILKTRGGLNVELRAGEWGTEHLIPRHGAWFSSDSGVSISERDAYGLPAVSNVIRSPAELIASLPFFVYKGDPRSEARDTWQWSLLHDQPSEYCDSFRFFYDLVLSLEATQNAFVQKFRGVGSRSGRLEALEVIDPHRVTVNVDKETGEKTFDIWVAAGHVRKGLTSREVLHVRGFTPNPGGAVGVSLIQLHANALGSQTQMQRFEGDYFRNNGVPPFWFTGAQNATHAQEIIDAYKAAHAGAGNRHKPGALWGNIDVKSIPISMADAMYAENKSLSVEDVCRIWRWPKEWVEAPSEGMRGDTSPRTAELLKLYVYPRLRRIERALAADPDLFPRTGRGTGYGFGSNLFGEFLSAALERADFVTRVRGYKDARQGGWVTANEIRGWENLPPEEGGDELQQTPVGGAPNPGGPVADKPEEDNTDD